MSPEDPTEIPAHAHSDPVRFPRRGLFRAPQRFDVVVYGGTAGGAIAAVSAAREGLKTALLEPTTHIGGMVSGGLGLTDFGKKEVIGGYAFEFYLRVGRHYGIERYGNEAAWYSNPTSAKRFCWRC